MDRFIEIFKRHPWWIVGGVLAVVVLIWLFSSGGSKTETAVVNVGASDALIAASAAERVEQIRTNAATVQGQLALEKAKNDNETAIAIMGIQSGVLANDNQTALGIVASNNSAAIQINSQNVVGATTLAQIDAKRQNDLAQKTIELAGVESDMMKSIAQKQADVEILSIYQGSLNRVIGKSAQN